MPLASTHPTYNNITLLAPEVKRSWEATLVNVNPATGTNNRAAGAKTTLTVNLLRITKRFTITGMIASTDEAALLDTMDFGGTYAFNWNGNIRSSPGSDGTAFQASVETLQITHAPKTEGEQDELPFTMTIVVGKDFGK